MSIFSLTGIIIIITNCFLSLLILIKAKARIQYIWIIFCLNVALWGLGVYMIGNENNPDRALQWWRIGYIGVINIPVLYTHFILEFLKIKKYFWLVILYLLTIFFHISNLFFEIFIVEVKLLFGNLYYISNPGILYNFFVILFFVTVVWAIVKMHKVIKVSQDNYRRQVIAFLWATYIGYVGGVFAFFPVYGLYFYPLLNVLVGLFPIIITYAILKHRMLDIRFVISGGIVYSMLLGVIVGFYILMLLSLNLVFGTINELITFFSGIITVIAGIYGVPIIEKYFRKKTNALFFKDVYDFPAVTYELSKVLNSNIDIKTLLRESSNIIKNVFKVDTFRFMILSTGLVMDESGEFRKPLVSFPKSLLGLIESEKLEIMNKQYVEQKIFESKNGNLVKQKEDLLTTLSIMNKYEIELIVPIYLEKALSALLIIGKKKSGDIFTEEDYRLLETFSYQAGVSIEKARLYEEVKKHSIDLEKKVAERTAKILGLQEGQQQMIHEMAHGLQTPLTILKSELSLLSKGEINNKKISEIERSIDNTSVFIYKMLRLAKLEASTSKSNFKQFNFSDLILGLIEEFEVVTREKKIKIEHEIEENVFFKGESSEIEEMVTNLVSNSVKYIGNSPEKKIKLVLKTEQKSLFLSVSDTGIGISKDDLGHLFERYYRAENNLSDRTSGTGLGLLISKRIVEKHNGKIEVLSKLGEGTVFVIRFKI